MRHVRILASTVALTLALSGCVGAAREAPSATATATPEIVDAMVAANSTYALYVEIINDLAVNPNSDPERLRQVEVDLLADPEIAAIKGDRAAGVTRTGTASFDNLRIESSEVDSEGIAHISTFLCIDLSQTRIQAADGADITPTSADRRSELNVEFLQSVGSITGFKIGRSEQWAEDGAC